MALAELVGQQVALVEPVAARTNAGGGRRLGSTLRCSTSPVALDALAAGEQAVPVGLAVPGC